MLKHTRISGKMDISRMGASISRPGIDSRSWVSLAIALGEAEVDSKHGVFVDVKLIPTGETLTARVHTIYAGSGFGLYMGKIHKDDEVVVEIPSGNPSEGIVVIARAWSASDLPPQDAIDNPEDITLVLEKDKNLRVTIQGKGKAIINVAKDVEVKVDGKVKLVCSDINLGEESPSDYAALAQKVLDELTKVKTDLDNLKLLLATHVHPGVIVGPGSTAVSPAFAGWVPHSPASVACQTTKVK